MKRFTVLSCAVVYPWDVVLAALVFPALERQHGVKWKQMVWMVRARFALETEGKRYRRHPRWLSMMFAREVAALWGHLGGATKTLQGPRGPPLMK